MKPQIDYKRWLLAVDLAIVTAWAVCTCWCLGLRSLAYTVVAPLIVIRLTMSFTLYRHEKNVLWLVGGSIVILGALVATLGADALTILIAPMTKFVENVWRFFTHDNSLMRGAYLLLTHPREEGIEGGGTWEYIAIWALSAWVYLAPIVWSAVLWCTKRFEKVKWPWKRLIGYGVCYILLSAVILVVSSLYLPIENGAHSFWSINPVIVWLFGTLLLALPFTWNLRPRFHKEVVESYVLLLVVCPLLVGAVTPKWGSLIVMVLCSAMMIYMMCQRWDGAKWKKSYWLYAFVIPANICFWSSQFVVDFWRYALVYLSFGLVLAGAVFYYIKKRKLIKTVAFAVCLGVLIPFFSVGYNLLACTYAKRIGVFDQYPYSWRGLLIVEGEEGIGIRDRYGMVIGPFNDKIEYLGQNAPYIRIKRQGYWDIADLETHMHFFDWDYVSIEPFRENDPRYRHVWAIEGESNGKSYFIYFKAPRYYSRFHALDYETSPEPVRHALSGEMLLDYIPDEVYKTEVVDEFLGRMVHAVWNKDEQTSHADHYWQWAQIVTADIDSLYTHEGMFHCDSLDRYETAMQQIGFYLSDAGCQASMNNCSYVYGICRNYLMHRKNIELANAMPEVDLRQEYRLFNEYQSYAEDFWEETHGTLYGHYSDRPREVNMEAAERFDARTELVTEFLDVIQNGKTIRAKGTRPSMRRIRKSFHEQMPRLLRPVGIECEYPTDTIGMYFLKWVDYRDQIANKMPAKLATSYRNQTTNIILHEMR